MIGRLSLLWSCLWLCMAVYGCAWLFGPSWPCQCWRFPTLLCLLQITLMQYYPRTRRTLSSEILNRVLLNCCIWCQLTASDCFSDLLCVPCACIYCVLWVPCATLLYCVLWVPCSMLQLLRAVSGVCYAATTAWCECRVLRCNYCVQWVPSTVPQYYWCMHTGSKCGTQSNFCGRGGCGVSWWQGRRRCVVVAGRLRCVVVAGEAAGCRGGRGGCGVSCWQGRDPSCRFTYMLLL